MNFSTEFTETEKENIPEELQTTLPRSIIGKVSSKINTAIDNSAHNDIKEKQMLKEMLLNALNETVVKGNNVVNSGKPGKKVVNKKVTELKDQTTAMEELLKRKL